MKSIICHFSSYNGFTLKYVILVSTLLIICHAHSTPPCGLYGAPPCQFLPAPPGQTPSCARPGKTYCEHIDNYPTYVIKHLVHKWGYEAKNLLVDETWDDFASVAWHDTPVFYDPAYIFPQKNNDFKGYSYDTPPYGNGGGGGGGHNYHDDHYQLTKSSSTEGPTYLLYTSSGQRLNIHKGHVGNPKTTPNNPTLWLKRIVRDLGHNLPPASAHEATEASGSDSDGPLIIDTLDGVDVSSPSSSASSTSSSSSSPATRDVSINMDLYDIVGADKGTKSRIRRQSPGRSSLCQTTTQFITPQAALNSKGNWMFVVNEASTARQMVKTELCASNTCSNLCQLPNGYNSRCEQKFVQKRLIALQGNGQNLYTDTFWFPSCCVCTIAAN